LRRPGPGERTRQRGQGFDRFTAGAQIGGPPAAPFPHRARHARPPRPPPPAPLPGRFPAEVIAWAVWLSHRFALSLRDVEGLRYERGIRVPSETIRAWVAKFGARHAAALRAREARPGRTWHPDAVFTRVGGQQVYLWRAVDEHGQVLDVLVRERRDADAAERVFRRLLGHAGGPPEAIVTDGLASYGAAKSRLPELATVEHRRVRAAARLNNRVEQSHQPTRLREQQMRRFKSVPSASGSSRRSAGSATTSACAATCSTASEHRAVRRVRYAIWRALLGTIALHA
jgi:putative transposase